MKYSLQWLSLRISATMPSMSGAKTAGSTSASSGDKNGVVFADENHSVEKIKITIVQRMTGPQLTTMEPVRFTLRLLGFEAMHKA